MTEREGNRKEQLIKSATVLFVDDEANILASLRRLFRNEGYTIRVAEGGAQGLEVLEHEAVDMVVSDMRMPEMDGATFLAKVSERWPTTVRILLTGYADLTSTIAAINQGHIFRYISKPWEDNDLKLTVRQGLEQRILRRERDRLLKLIRKQNLQLKELNSNLEAKVVSRTEEIRQTADMLDLAYRELEQSYRDAIPVFASLVELREGSDAGHGRRVAQMAQALARYMAVDEEQVQDIYFAGLLHDIGKLGVPDEVLERPYVALSAEQRRVFNKHPVLGQAALMALEPLQVAGRLIRHHHERFDGKGYPDRLTGEEIPLGARILSVVNDYDSLQVGTLVEGNLSTKEARNFLDENASGRYDPEVVEAFLKWLAENPLHGADLHELRMTSDDLRSDMVLARDLLNSQGLLLLSQGHVLDDALIARIRLFEREEKRGFTIYVKHEPEVDDA